MTVVTTSRKPAPELRTLGKDLAFTTEARYVPRGKMGLYEVTDLDKKVLLLSREGRINLLQLFMGGQVVSEIRFVSFRVEERPGVLVRGLRTGDQTVYESLGRYLNVLMTDGEEESTISFDGTQKRRYIISLKL